MPIPWLRILDLAIGLTAARRRPSADEQLLAVSERRGALGHLEARLAGVVVAALREAFDRDSRRLELEREQMEAERQRLERGLRLELARQVGDREIARYRLVAGLAAASWLGTLFLSARLIGAGAAARVTLAGGWVLLLGALAASFVAQSRVGDALARIGEAGDRPIAPAPGAAGALAPWLIVIGLALVGVSVLVA